MTAPAPTGDAGAPSTGPATDAAKTDAAPATDAAKTDSTKDAAPKADDAAAELQAQLDALKAERDAHAAKLKEIEDAKLTEAERATKELEELRAENARVKTEQLATKVAAAKGLPADLASLLTGEKAAMEKLADKIMTHINAAKEDAAKGDAGKNGLGTVTKVNGTSLTQTDAPKFDPKAAAKASFGGNRRGR